MEELQQHQSADIQQQETGGSGIGEGQGSQERTPRKTVRSFVRRSSHIDERLKRARERYAEDLLLNVGDEQESGSLGVRPGVTLSRKLVRDTWGNDHSLVVEIGSGQGENVVAAAQGNPDMNFLALEVYDQGVAHTMLMAGKLGLRNLRICQVDASDLMAVAEPGVASQVWTFFPDPWPKMRHHKRRIVQPALAEHVHRALVDGGSWRLATDIEDYALHVHEVMDGRSDFRNAGELQVSLPVEHVGKGTVDEAMHLEHALFTESERFKGRMVTNFERKGIAAGRVIHDFEYVAQ